MEELFTFIERKKDKIYLIPLVDRATRCILGWSLVWERTKKAIQLILDDTPKAGVLKSRVNEIFDNGMVFALAQVTLIALAPSFCFAYFVLFDFASAFWTFHILILPRNSALPKAKGYFSDGFDAYARLWYHYGRYEVSKWKNDTFLVEADNAKLRH